MSPDPASVFEEQLEKATHQYLDDRERHKRRAVRLKMSTSALGAGATVLLGWQHPGMFEATMKNGALVLTSLVTVFASYDAFFEPRKLWVRETFVLNSLRDLQREWDIAKATGKTDPASVTVYSAKFKDILHESLTEWVEGKNKTLV